MEKMEVTLTKSNKGGEKIFIDNFGYHFRKKNINNEYRWECAHRKLMLCRSSVITQKDGMEHTIKVPPTEHSHPKIEHEKVVCRVNNYMKAIAKEKSALKPSEIIQKVAMVVDPLTREHLPSEKAQMIKIHRVRSKKRKMEKVDIHSNSDEKVSKCSEDDACWNCFQDDRNNQKILKIPEREINSKSVHLEEESLHIDDLKYIPKREPIVYSEESDGTVNIRIFLEESLLSSFVINAHHTSNVNIRIAKDDLHRNSKF